MSAREFWQRAGGAPGQLDVQAEPDLAVAREAILERDVYGAVVVGPSGVRELLVALSLLRTRKPPEGGDAVAH